MLLLLQHEQAEAAKQYINTTQAGWLGFVAANSQLFPIRRTLLARATIHNDDLCP
jgi:hypothetical protein